eukprot:738452-Rhodomonas_salina.1
MHAAPLHSLLASPQLMHAGAHDTLDAHCTRNVTLMPSLLAPPPAPSHATPLLSLLAPPQLMRAD